MINQPEVKTWRLLNSVTTESALHSPKSNTNPDKTSEAATPPFPFP